MIDVSKIWTQDSLISGFKKKNHGIITVLASTNMQNLNFLLSYLDRLIIPKPKIKVLKEKQ